MRVLGLDYGAKRIGLALSDPDAAFAFPVGALERRGRKHDLGALRELAAEREVGCIVMGLPIHMNGRAGPEAEAARAFARELAEVTSLPVELLDERWTSREAERALRDAGPRAGRRRRGGGRKGKAARGEVDAVAAAIILRTWLARSRDAGGTAGRDEAGGKG